MSELDDESVDAIEERLRRLGTRKRENTVVDRVLGIGIDVDDLRRRRERQSRRHRIVGVVTVGAALVISAGAVTASVRGPAIDEAVPLHEPAPDGDPELSGQASGQTRGGTRSSAPATSPTTRSTTTIPALPPTTAPPTTTPPTTQPTAPSSERGRSDNDRRIRQVDVAAVAVRDARCPYRPGRTRTTTPKVEHVDYGDVLGDGDDDAVVTVSCPGQREVQASVYTLEPTSSSGVKRVTTVAPDPEARAELAAQRILGWTLTGVSLQGSTVESRWIGGRRSFTLRQRWAGHRWRLTGPPEISRTR